MIEASRIRLNRAGYDSNGAYYGAGLPVFLCSEYDESGRELDSEAIRAVNKAAAIERYRAAKRK